MKKKIGIMIGTMAAAALIGIGISQTGVANADPALNLNEIKAKVTEQYPGTVTELELDDRSSKPVYEVEIKNGSKEYELKVDGNTGEVLNLDEKEMNNKQADVAIAEKETNNDTKSENNNEQANNDNKNTATANNASKKAVIGDEKARSIAASQFSGTIVELDLDEDDGRLIYEIEMKKGNSEAEIEIDAYTGTILVLDIDYEENEWD